MNTTMVAAGIALAALLGGAAGCASTASSEEAALDRAYHKRVSVTGSRIRHRVDARGKGPEVTFPLDTLEGAEAQESLREMKDAQRQRY